MPHAIQMTEYGPPSVLEWVETDSRPFDPEEVRLDVIAAPVNRADVDGPSGPTIRGPTRRVSSLWAQSPRPALRSTPFPPATERPR
jgi:hypothetical protein